LAPLPRSDYNSPTTPCAVTPSRLLIALALFAIVAALVIGYAFGRAHRIRSYEAEATSVRRDLSGASAAETHLDDLASDRSHLFGELAQARAETARYRQLVIDLENQSPPPLLGAPGTPDNLKLIVGVGPVLERMLYQLGITTYRQIARWTEHDIDEFDAKLPEFPGRIRRDDWVTQARALHQSAYGENLPPRAPR